MQFEGRKKSTGAAAPVQTDQHGRMITTIGDLGQAAIEGRLYYYATQGEVACSTEMNTTFTGLAIGNPNGSGKYYVMHEFGYAQSALIADETEISLAVGDIKGLTNATPTEVKSALIGGTMSSEALADEGATITAPTRAKFVVSLDDQAAGVQWTSGPQVLDLRGSIVLSPGSAIFTNSTYAIAAVMYFHFVWEEVEMA